MYCVIIVFIKMTWCILLMQLQSLYLKSSAMHSLMSLQKNYWKK